VNTVSGTKPKHNTIQAAVKKVNSIPIRPSIIGNYLVFISSFSSGLPQVPVCDAIKINWSMMHSGLHAALVGKLCVGMFLGPLV